MSYLVCIESFKSTNPDLIYTPGFFNDYKEEHYECASLKEAKEVLHTIVDIEKRVFSRNGFAMVRDLRNARKVGSEWRDAPAMPIFPGALKCICGFSEI